MRFSWNRAGVVLLLLSFFVVASLGGCTSRANHDEANARKPHPTIVFMTDFGTANDAVAICKAVIIGIVPDVRIMDISHQVTPFSIEEGARFLSAREEEPAVPTAEGKAKRPAAKGPAKSK